MVQRYTEAMRKLIPLLMAAVLGAPLLLSTPAVAQSARDIQRLEEQVNLAKARGDWNAAQNLEVQLNMARLQYQRNNGMGEVNDRYNNNGYWNGGNRAYYPPRNNGNWNNRNNGNWNNRRDRDRARATTDHVGGPGEQRAHPRHRFSGTNSPLGRA